MCIGSPALLVPHLEASLDSQVKVASVGQIGQKLIFFHTEMTRTSPVKLHQNLLEKRCTFAGFLG